MLSRFVSLSTRYITADPLEVAITATIPEATAYLIGTPSNVRRGLSSTSPPKSARAPMKPEGIEISKSVRRSILE